MTKLENPSQLDVAGPAPRHKTTQVMVGNVAVGGGAPIVVQSMTNTDTADVDGTIAQVTYFRIRLMPPRSSESTSVKRDASAASCAAYASRPTLVAVKAPPPATTKLPDITSSPGRLSTGSASRLCLISSDARSSAFTSPPVSSIRR